jgi:hypothetical protein
MGRRCIWLSYHKPVELAKCFICKYLIHYCTIISTQKLAEVGAHHYVKFGNHCIWAHQNFWHCYTYQHLSTFPLYDNLMFLCNRTKMFPTHTTKTHTRNRGAVPLIPKLVTKWTWVVSRPGRFIPVEKVLSTIECAEGGPQSRNGALGKEQNPSSLAAPKPRTIQHAA